MNLRTSRLLHEEHMAVRTVLDRLSAVLGRYGAGQPPPGGDAVVSAVFGDLDTCIRNDITRHFDFEEEAVFPHLVEAGESAIVEMLEGEHREITPLFEPITRFLGTARSGATATAAQWNDFRAQALELETRLSAHIAKEEAGLIEAVEDAIDESTDLALAPEGADA